MEPAHPRCDAPRTAQRGGGHSTIPAGSRWVPLGLDQSCCVVPSVPTHRATFARVTSLCRDDHWELDTDSIYGHVPPPAQTTAM